MWGCLAVVIGRWLFAGTSFRGWAGLIRFAVLLVFAVVCILVWSILFTVVDASGQPVAPYQPSKSLNLLYAFTCLPIFRVLMAPPRVRWLLITIPATLGYFLLMIVASYVIADPSVLVVLGIAAFVATFFFEARFRQSSNRVSGQRSSSGTVDHRSRDDAHLTRSIGGIDTPASDSALESGRGRLNLPPEERGVR